MGCAALMKYKKINKKGSAFDMAYAIAGLFALVITLMIINIAWDEVEEDLSVSEADNPTVIQVLERGDVMVSMYDQIVVGGVIGSFIVLIILAAIIPTSPIFMVAFLLYTAVMTMVSAVISNTYDIFIASNKVADIADAYPMTTLIFENLPLITVMLGAILLIVTYSKQRSISQV